MLCNYIFYMNNECMSSKVKRIRDAIVNTLYIAVKDMQFRLFHPRVNIS